MDPRLYLDLTFVEFLNLSHSRRTDDYRSAGNISTTKYTTNGHLLAYMLFNYNSLERKCETWC